MQPPSRNLTLRPNSALASRHWLRWCHRFLIGSLFTSLVTLPGQAAERIIFQYGFATRSLEIASIERFVIDGTIAEDLDFYLRQLGVPDAERLAYRDHLLQPIEVDPILLNRFLNSRLGAEILTELGNIVRTPNNLNGGLSLRAAITLAAQEPDGLTPLNILRNLPTDLQIDLGDIQALQQAVQRITDGTAEATDSIKQLATVEASQIVIDYADLPDLRSPGRFAVQQSRFELYDASRDRSFYVEVYQPRQRQSEQMPVVIFSHGLGDSPQAYHQEAVHLASYGFFVAIPQHPGSDRLQQEAFKQGTTSEIYEINEFIDRPGDITYLLDELESRNAAEYEGRLDLQNVGMGGHSFGGYTALALAGATIDFENLTEDCRRNYSGLKK